MPESRAPKRPKKAYESENNPDKLMFCCMMLVEHTGRGGGVLCPKCRKKMSIAAEFPKGTWKK